jgi:hypothetical protein
MSSEWAAIETAPRDGCYLIANAKGQVCPVNTRDGFSVVSNMVGFADWDFGSVATHWMKLPEPPK